MRLLYVADNGFSYKDGAYYYTKPNDNNLKQFGKYFDEVVFLARANAFSDGQIAINPKHKVFLVKKYSFIKLKKQIKSIGNMFDVVLLRNGFNGVFLANTLKKMGKIVIGYCGADPFVAQLTSPSLVKLIKGLIWRRMERRKMRLADYTHYCCHFLADAYPCSNAQKSLICSNVNVNPIEENLSNRLKKTIDSSIIKIGLVGRFCKNDIKGIFCALKALMLLDKRFVLEVVGNGDTSKYDRFAEKHGIQNRFIKMGYISDQQELGDWYKSIDIYIQPSKSEGLPRSVIEAMSFGCPCVASNVGGVAEILSQDAIIQVNDASNLAAIITRYVKDKAFLVSQEKRNFEESKRFSSTKRDKLMDDFYYSIVEKQ